MSAALDAFADNLMLETEEEGEMRDERRSSEAEGVPETPVDGADDRELEIGGDQQQLHRDHPGERAPKPDPEPREHRRDRRRDHHLGPDRPLARAKGVGHLHEPGIHGADPGPGVDVDEDHGQQQHHAADHKRHDLLGRRLRRIEPFLGVVFDDFAIVMFVVMAHRSPPLHILEMQALLQS